jgi:hypothetical protein
MEQTVMVFADAAARTTALTGVVSEGMLSYLKSTKQVEVYNGSAWVASDDPNAIQNTIVDAKGDLITATAADTPARLAVGSNGETLVADSAASTGLRWQGNYAAGKNKFINGDFGIWQRGTSFTITSFMYTCDRFFMFNNGNGSITASRQTFTPGTAPVAGYEGQFFFRSVVASTGTTSTLNFGQRIENVQTLAGQTSTLSFWAKADAARTVGITATQSFGSGGSADVSISFGTVSLTTSWQRFSITVAIPSISGKTIGANNNLTFDFGLPTVASTIDIWGVQLEAGNVATAFQTATGTLQGEIAACQRYYQVVGGVDAQFPILQGGNFAATLQDFRFPISFPVKMRTAPTGTKNGTWNVSNCGQPSLTFISADGYAPLVVVNATSVFYAYPNSSDDTFTFSAEL